MRLYIPVGEKWELSKSCIPTGDMLVQTNHDRQYLTGSQVPVLHDIDNDVFFAEEGSLDGKPFYGAVATGAATGKRICYEVCKAFKFWVVWNDHGDKDTSVQRLAHGSSMHQTSRFQEKSPATENWHRESPIR